MTVTTLTPRAQLLSSASFNQLRWWSRRQWMVVATVSLLAFLAIGWVGQTLPPTWNHRGYALEWWNWVTLPVSALMLGLIAGTFTLATRRRFVAGAGSGGVGMVAAVVMACPVCSPLAIPLLGTGAALSFLTPYRGWMALLSLGLLSWTLLLRLRASSSCTIAMTGKPRVAPDPRDA